MQPVARRSTFNFDLQSNFQSSLTPPTDDAKHRFTQTDQTRFRQSLLRANSLNPDQIQLFNQQYQAQIARKKVALAKKIYEATELLNTKRQQLSRINKDNTDSSMILDLAEFKLMSTGRPSPNGRKSQMSGLIERTLKTLETLRKVNDELENKHQELKDNHENMKGFYKKLQKEVNKNLGVQDDDADFKEYKPVVKRKPKRVDKSKVKKTVNVKTHGKSTVQRGLHENGVFQSGLNLSISDVRELSESQLKSESGDGIRSKNKLPSTNILTLDDMDFVKSDSGNLQNFTKMTPQSQMIEESEWIQLQNDQLTDSETYKHLNNQVRVKTGHSDSGQEQLVTESQWLQEQNEQLLNEQMIKQLKEQEEAKRLRNLKKFEESLSSQNKTDNPMKKSRFLNMFEAQEMKNNYESYNPSTHIETAPVFDLSSSYASQAKREMKAWTLEEFIKFKRTNKGISARKLSEMIAGEQAALQDDQLDESELSSDAQSHTSSLHESLLEELDEELERTGVQAVKRGFSVGKTIRAYKPLKVSFVIGVSESMEMTFPAHRMQKDRVYKDFRISSIQWHLKDKAICGIKLKLTNDQLTIPLRGHFHGVKGNDMIDMKLSKGETFLKVEYAATNSEIVYIKLSTSLNNTWTIGLSEAEVVSRGLHVIHRYFPREIMLFNFFCKYNSQTQRIENIRFLYVKTIVYRLEQN